MYVRNLLSLELKGSFNFTRKLTTSSVNYLNQTWRKEKKLPMNPNAYGVLTDAPDYTYLDGRPTPYGSNQTQRLIKQKEYAEKIIELTKEIDFAVERHKNLLEERKKNKEDILNNKLKPKGILLLKKN